MSLTHATAVACVMIFVFVLTSDAIFAADFFNLDSLSAFTTITPVLMVFPSMGLLFGMGAARIIERYAPSNYLNAMRETVLRSAILLFVCSVFVTAIVWATADWFLPYLGADGRIFAPAKEVIEWFLPFAPFVSATGFMMFITALDNKGWLAVTLTLMALVLDFTLNHLFVNVFNWGVSGIALGSNIALFLLFGAFFVHFFKPSSNLRFSRPNLVGKPVRESAMTLLATLKEIVAGGYMAFLRLMSVSMLFLIGNSEFYNHLGEKGVAAYCFVSLYFPIAIIIWSVITYFYRVRNWPMKIGSQIMTAAVISAVTSFLATFYCEPLTGLVFSKEPAYHRIVIEGAPVFSLGYIFYSVNVMILSNLNYFNLENRELIIILSWGYILPTAIMLSLPHIWSGTGLWIGLPLSQAITSISLAFLALHRVGAQNKATHATAKRPRRF